jgi:hypothetical protein
MVRLAITTHVGCVVIARETVTDIIRNYVHGCDTVAAGARDMTQTGFRLIELFGLL